MRIWRVYPWRVELCLVFWQGQFWATERFFCNKHIFISLSPWGFIGLCPWRQWQLFCRQTGPPKLFSLRAHQSGLRAAAQLRAKWNQLWLYLSLSTYVIHIQWPESSVSFFETRFQIAQLVSNSFCNRGWTWIFNPPAPMLVCAPSCSGRDVNAHWACHQLLDPQLQVWFIKQFILGTDYSMLLLCRQLDLNATLLILLILYFTFQESKMLSYYCL